MTNKVYFPLLDIENVTPILERISIFGGLDDKQLYQLFRSLLQVEYKVGEEIFKKGDKPSYIYIIKKGKVEILLEGRKYTMKKAVLEVGQCFGESSVIGIQSHTATAIAIENCELMVLSCDALMRFFNEDKELFGMLILNIARETSRRLHSTDQDLLHYFQGE